MKTNEEMVEEFEQRWLDKGDERYGWVKHNNTIIQQQIDWLRTTLEAKDKECEERVREERERIKVIANDLLPIQNQHAHNRAVLRLNNLLTPTTPDKQ